MSASKTAAFAILLTFAAAPARAQNVSELYVHPDTLRLEPGQRRNVTVQAFDASGNVVLKFRYILSDTAVARITPGGTVLAGRPGQARITIQAGSRSAAVVVLVSGAAPTAAPALPSAPDPAPSPSAPPPPPSSDSRTSAAPRSSTSGGTAGSRRTGAGRAVAQLVAEPGSLVLLPTEVGRLSVRGLRSDGQAVEATGVRWRSLQPAVAQVDASTGAVTAMGTGQTLIEASAPGGAAVSVPVSVALTEIAVTQPRLVLPAEARESLVVVVPSQGERRLRPLDLQWSVSDSAVLQVSPGGTVRALAPGRAEVVVRGFLQERRVPVTVHRRVEHAIVSPAIVPGQPVRLPMNGTRIFSVLPRTADSVPVDGVPITWVVEDTAIAVFDPVSGTLHGRHAGSTTLSYSLQGAPPRSWRIEVVTAGIALERTRLGLRPGEEVALAARFVDSNGEVVGPATGLSWVTGNPEVARVRPDGTVLGVSVGRAVVTARGAGGVAAEAVVFVTADLLVASNRAGSGRYGLYGVMISGRQNFWPIIADTFASSLDGVYSPDRTRIAFASDRFGGFDIFVADADGRNPVRLTTDRGLDRHPLWTPDGRSLVFTSTRTGANQVYLMGVDGTGLKQLTSLPGGADEPALSPDGRRVAFAGHAGGRGEGDADIYTVALAGGPPEGVTSTRGRRESQPFFLPSGELAWVLTRRNEKERDLILSQPAGGGPPSQMVSSEASVIDVVLAPDGSRLAWVATRAAPLSRTGSEFTLQWRSLANGVETSVRLLPGERIASPSF